MSDFELLSNDTLERMSYIIGTQSAAAKAIAERDRRVERGEVVVVMYDRKRHMLVVGPPPQTFPPAA